MDRFYSPAAVAKREGRNVIRNIALTFGLPSFVDALTSSELSPDKMLYAAGALTVALVAHTLNRVEQPNLVVPSTPTEPSSGHSTR